MIAEQTVSADIIADSARAGRWAASLDNLYRVSPKLEALRTIALSASYLITRDEALLPAIHQAASGFDEDRSHEAELGDELEALLFALLARCGIRREHQRQRTHAATPIDLTTIDLASANGATLEQACDAIEHGAMADVAQDQRARIGRELAAHALIAFRSYTKFEIALRITRILANEGLEQRTIDHALHFLRRQQRLSGAFGVEPGRSRLPFQVAYTATTLWTFYEILTHDRCPTIYSTTD